MTYINYDDKLMTYHDRLLNLVYNELNLVADEEMSKRIDFVLTTLYEREKQVLELRYNQGLTLDEVGALLNITKERVRQIECKAIRKLRHPSRLKTITEPEMCVELQNRITMLTKLQQDSHRTLNNLEERLKLLESEHVEELNLINQIKEKYNFNLTEVQPNLTINDVDLSVRSYKCLKGANYNKLSDIAKLSYNDLTKIRNLGINSINEIKSVLLNNGYTVNW